jgi:radical SAM/Cys-rich protein
MNAPPIPSFEKVLQSHALPPLRADAVATLQVNVGRLCNQGCRHCHVEAGPSSKEIMTPETAEQVVAAIRRCRFATVDLTGGAPEMNPSFRYLVSSARDEGAHVIVRHNLTIQFEPGMEGLPEFFRERRLEVVASLPYFLAQQTDSQRGAGVFERSLEGLRRLNALGYGKEGTGLDLVLVYNPAGAFLPPDQQSLERDFKRELSTRYGVVFNRLYTLTNMPINRFLAYLHRSGNYERYMMKLVESFNPAAVSGLMCRNLISVAWDGRLFDCDFNQMLNLGLQNGHPKKIANIDIKRLASRDIATGMHCFGCTAGSGSSCGGAIEG